MENIQKITKEEYDIINSRLLDKYGFIELEGQRKPYFRLRWSEDLLEKRWMTHTNEGFQLIHPEVREVPKYCHYFRNRYVLEGLMAVPILVGEGDDRIDQITYEPVWVFESGEGKYLPPQWKAIYFILEQQRANVEARGKQGVKYRDPESTPEEAKEEKRKRIKEIEEALWGNETEITDALTYKEGIVVPHSYTTQKES